MTQNISMLTNEVVKLKEDGVVLNAYEQHCYVVRSNVFYCVLLEHFSQQRKRGYLIQVQCLLRTFWDKEFQSVRRKYPQVTKILRKMSPVEMRNVTYKKEASYSYFITPNPVLRCIPCAWHGRCLTHTIQRMHSSVGDFLKRGLRYFPIM